MKIRDSGMPEESLWATFFDPDVILTALGFEDPGANVAEFGCGYGTFTTAVAARTSGKVFGYDIEPSMVSTTQTKANQLGLDNVHCTVRDFVREGTGLASASVDYAMLFNILHTKNPLGLLQEARRILRPHGRLAVIHWNPDPTTPRGPDMSIRPSPEQCLEWIKEAGLRMTLPHVSLPPYHFGLLAENL